jgi:predicted DNA-binding transcriptional regulator AlpA
MTRYVDRREVAVAIGVTVQTLARWNAQGKGPPCIRLEGRRARYKVNDVIAWLESRPAGGQRTNVTE